MRIIFVSTDIEIITNKTKKSGGKTIMTNKQINTINRYFDNKHMDRKQLEAVLDFDNLTMDEKYIPEIMKLLKSGEDEVGENIIKNYVRFVKRRSGAGEITWDEFISRLKKLELEYSDYGIRVQRFSKSAYWEIFFNHFSTTDYEDGNVKLTFDQEYYEEAERENAYEVLFEHDIDTDSEENNIMSQVAAKWNELSEEDKDSIISAFDAIYATHYVDKSRVDIINNEVKKITMTNADLVPEVGLRDYSLELADGNYIDLRF